MEIKIITSYDDLIKDLIHEKITMVRPDEFKTVLNNFDLISKVNGI